MDLIQVNLQAGFGGGEVYTCFLGKALAGLGVPFRLIVNNRANWWKRNETFADDIISIRDAEEIPLLGLGAGSLLLYHTPDRGQRLAQLRGSGVRLASLAHMPAYQRETSYFAGYDLVIPVSRYVRDGLLTSGLANVYDEPLYGVAHLRHRERGLSVISAQSRYQWDTRKGRDLLLSKLEPIWQALTPTKNFSHRPGLTLGIVSRITPIKQFPRLFQAIAPALAEFPSVNIEVFGSGGYASVRDTRIALRPILKQVRWWGHQDDVEPVYPLLDFMITGLPEKEALGLNVLESQLCGTPVLAPDAPPFSETIVHGAGGYLYPDPRQDNGAGFRALIAGLVRGSLPRPNPLQSSSGLDRFSEAAFRVRVAGLLRRLESIIS